MSRSSAETRNSQLGWTYVLLHSRTFRAAIETADDWNRRRDSRVRHSKVQPQGVMDGLPFVHHASQWSVLALGDGKNTTVAAHFCSPPFATKYVISLRDKVLARKHAHQTWNRPRALGLSRFIRTRTSDNFFDIAGQDPQPSDAVRNRMRNTNVSSSKHVKNSPRCKVHNQFSHNLGRLLLRIMRCPKKKHIALLCRV